MSSYYGRTRKKKGRATEATKNAYMHGIHCEYGVYNKELHHIHDRNIKCKVFCFYNCYVLYWSRYTYYDEIKEVRDRIGNTADYGTTDNNLKQIISSYSYYGLGLPIFLTQNFYEGRTTTIEDDKDYAEHHKSEIVDFV